MTSPDLYSPLSSYFIKRGGNNNYFCVILEAFSDTTELQLVISYLHPPSLVSHAPTILGNVQLLALQTFEIRIAFYFTQLIHYLIDASRLVAFCIN